MTLPRPLLRLALAAACALAAPGGAPAQEGGGARTPSGTAWQPDETPTRALHASAAGWSLMLHGSASLARVREATPRGGSRLGSVNWAMLHAEHPLGAGSLALAAMGSAETLTTGECGLPRLLARGPGCSADAFGEYQHPHPPLAELSARVRHPLRGPLAVEGYAALAGEPALGPVAYSHRLSAAADPLAPISHHDTNPAHGSGGVLTAAVGTTLWRAEASLFDGDPADPDRLLPRPGPLRSSAARLSLNPSRRWSLQLSTARIDAGEGHHAGASAELRVLTASAVHHRPVRGGVWATTAAWGRMDDGTLPGTSLLLESSLPLAGAHTLFARAEAADRLETRLTIVEHPDGSHDHLVDATRRRVGQLSAGYAWSRRLGAAAVGAGVRASVSLLPATLLPAYGERRPTGFALFATLTPAPAAGHQH